MVKYILVIAFCLLSCEAKQPLIQSEVDNDSKKILIKGNEGDVIVIEKLYLDTL